MKFSVIIPLYNKAPYVAKAIYSIIEQTYINWELIVIDDGSQDDSLKVVEELRKTDLLDIEKQGRFRLISQTNAGVATTRNRGVGLAIGEYICFLDADDWWAPTFLEEMDRLIVDFPEAGIYANGYYYVKNKRNRIISIGPKTDFTKGVINYCAVYAEHLVMPLWTGAICVPKKVFLQMQGFKSHLKLGEDFDLWIRIALRYPVVVNNQPLAYYNQDVDLQNRAIGRLHEPQHHMLWNLAYLQEEEMINADYKRLIDKIRVNALFPYYLSKQYREAAKDQLRNVDWTKQPKFIRQKYAMSVWALKGLFYCRVVLSKIKQKCIRLFICWVH